MRTRILLIAAMLSLLQMMGCATLRPAADGESRRARLAVLCTDHDLRLPARWCSEVAPHRRELPSGAQLHEPETD